MTDQSHGSSSLRTLESSDDEQRQFDNEIATACANAIDDFRHGQITKAQAQIQLHQALQSKVPADMLELSYTHYTGILDNFESHTERNASAKSIVQDQLGQGLSEPRGGGANSPREGSREPGDEYQPESDNAILNEIATLKARRRRSPSSVDASISNSSSKRRKVDESKFYWKEDKSSQPCDEYLERTRSAYATFARDPKFVKAEIINSFGCPPLPDSEWTNIVTGRCVNLDKVLSGLFSATADDKQVTAIGDSAELVTHSAVPAKKVKTHGEWLTAWTTAANAIRFVFPYRASELAEYTQYISSEFAAVGLKYHDRVINLDVAIRSRVAQSRNLRYTDYIRFADL
jgi:hypothetical protein